jgi:uroporphyrinogen-III synthase
VLGGVLGGAAVALLVLWYQSGGDELAALQARVNQVEDTVASASGDDGRVETLAERIQALEGASGDELVSRLEALEAQVEGQGATQAQLEGDESDEGPALSGRLAEIEAALAQLPGDDPQLAQLEQRLAALESASTSAEGDAATDDGAAALQDAVSALQERLEALSARLPEDTQDRLSQLDQRLGAAEQAESRLQELSGSVDQLTQKVGADEQQAQELAGQLSALGERVSGAESRLEAAERNRNRATALALIVGQLEAAIDEGRPYETQVQALTAMTQNGGDDSVAPGDEAIRQAVSELDPGAASGVPSIAALRQSFVPIANEIVHASRAPDGDNLLNRATDNLMRLVTVRPVGDDVRGDTAEARVARAEAALDKGDLAAAVAELDQLEGRPAEAAADWLSRAKARLGADQAVAQLRAQATDLLSQSN